MDRAEAGIPRVEGAPRQTRLCLSLERVASVLNALWRAHARNRRTLAVRNAPRLMRNLYEARRDATRRAERRGEGTRAWACVSRILSALANSFATLAFQLSTFAHRVQTNSLWSTSRVVRDSKFLFSFYPFLFLSKVKVASTA